MPSGDFHRKKTHCPQGHEYNEANTYWQRNRHGNDGRCCRECQKLRMQRKREDPARKAVDAARAAKWRKSNPETYRAGYRRVEQEKKQMLLDARSGGCIKCGEKDPSCLDFHHRDGGLTKEGHIGVFRRFSRARIQAEIAKCDVLCANCHRKHHRDERERKAA